MHLQKYLQILWGTWWIVMAMFLISTGLGIAYSYSQSSVYEATATFVVNPSINITETFDIMFSIDTLAGRSSIATTYSNILDSRVIIEEAAASLQVPPQMLNKYEINAVVLPDSSVLLLQIQGPSPDLAADLANAIGTSGLTYINNLQEIFELRRLDSAVVNPIPIAPNHLIDIAMGAIIGLAGGIGFVVLRQVLLGAFGSKQANLTPALTDNEVDSLEELSKELKDVKNAPSKAFKPNFSTSQPD
jgi:capsular polysaccharide biosynthesis protein